jgi:hypothetical protein
MFPMVNRYTYRSRPAFRIRLAFPLREFRNARLANDEKETARNEREALLDTPVGMSSLRAYEPVISRSTDDRIHSGKLVDGWPTGARRTKIRSALWGWRRIFSKRCDDASITLPVQHVVSESLPRKGPKRE